MAHFDVFNGDADGMCALHQLRLAHPTPATLVTGPKRDTALLQRVNAQAGDTVTVLDVSLDVNRRALLALLNRGVRVEYFDHHNAGEVPVHAGLHAIIGTAPDVCTGIVVDRWLGGAHRPWAVVAAFGDNLAQAALVLAQPLQLQAPQIAALRELGECLNYNAYGDTEADLLMHPADLYAVLCRHPDPFTFIAEEPVFQTLHAARQQDMAMARDSQTSERLADGRIILLPDAAWSRRVRGEYGNLMATSQPGQAHAVLTPNALGGYMVSVRAPLATLRGADRLCKLFPNGGGRPAAAGIDHLPKESVPEFMREFVQAFPPAPQCD